MRGRIANKNDGTKITIEDYQLKDDGSLVVVYYGNSNPNKLSVSHDDWTEFAEYDMELGEGGGKKYYTEQDEDGGSSIDHDQWLRDQMCGNLVKRLMDYLNLKKTRVDG